MSKTDLIVLTDEQMQDIKNAAEEDRQDPHGSALARLWHIVEPDFDNMERIDPTNYVMQRVQVEELMQHCLRISHHGMFCWINVGPSSR